MNSEHGGEGPEGSVGNSSGVMGKKCCHVIVRVGDTCILNDEAGLFFVDIRGVWMQI